MIPTPKLDDRTFKDLVEEAIRLIPQYCPEWTNHNPADPGITLIELFAWMLEMVIYRLNRVPEKNYLEFLNLLGIRLRPPLPASTVIQFKLNEKAQYAKVPKGTTVSTRPSPEGKVISFETDRDILVVKNLIRKVASQYGRHFSDNSAFIENPRPEGFHPFAGQQVCERYLYLGDEELAHYALGASLRVFFKCPHPSVSALLEALEFEVSSENGFEYVEPIFSEQGEDSIVLGVPKRFSKALVGDVTSWFVRARLVGKPSEETSLIDAVMFSLESPPEGILPERVFTRTAEEIFLTHEPDKRFLPFGRDAKAGCELYLKCDQAFAHGGALVRVELPVDHAHEAPPNASSDLVLVWEYYSLKPRKGWKELGKVHFADDRVETKEGALLQDTTRALTKAGTVIFSVPEDIAKVEVNGEEGYFFRCRILSGDYGVPGQYELVGDRWVFKDERPLRPPTLRGVTLHYRQVPHHFTYVFAENDGVLSDFSAIAKTEGKPFQPFVPVADASPALYIGFEDSFPQEEIQIYFELANESGIKEGTQPTVVFEYFNGREFKNLFAEDETLGFTRSGFVRFVGPADFRRSKRFGENLYFIRARLEGGGYVEPPMIRRILLNCTGAQNFTTYHEHILGSSLGVPNQSFKLPFPNVLSGQEVWVIEREKPSESALQTIQEEEGEDAVFEDPEGRGYFVRWHEVENLYESGGNSRHYVKDIVRGEIRFGDGVRGMIPPKGDRNVILRNYRVGGGVEGNVSANSLVVIKQALSLIEGATNPIPASGGADLETIEEIKQRAPFIFRSRMRAVTAEDFEWIAKEASTFVARAKCLPCKDKEGEVTVVIVPKVPPPQRGEEGAEFVKPVPSSELMLRVKKALDEKKLVSTIVHVTRPRYRDLAIKVVLVRQPSFSAETVKSEVQFRIKEFLDPLVGGKNKKGWQFGRQVSKIDIYHVVEAVPGVEFVEKVAITDMNNNIALDFVRLEEDELPYAMKVDVEEVSLERFG